MQTKPVSPIFRNIYSLCAFGSLLALPLIAGPLDGHWSSFSQDLLPTQGDAYRLSSDSQGVVYLSTAKTTFTYNGTRFDSLPNLKPEEVPALINGLEDYWLVNNHPSLDYWLRPRSEVVHVVHGTRQSPAGCLAGNELEFFGQDAQGKLLVSEGHTAQFGPVFMNLIRYSDQGCDTVDIDVKKSGMSPVAYARDSLGQEYFAIQQSRDIMECGPVVRLDHGKLDTILDSACVSGMVSKGSEILIAADQGKRSGLWIASSSGSRQIKTILGQPITQPRGLFQDRHGLVWVGSYDGSLLALADKDTVLFSPGITDFKGQFSLGLAEDAEGNLWLSNGKSSGLSIFLRGHSPLSIAKRIQPKYQGYKAYAGVNVLGRMVHGLSADRFESPSKYGNRILLDPAHRNLFSF